MTHEWSTTIVETEAQALHILAELYGKQWLCRGQSRPYGNLLPLIDRPPRDNKTRGEMLDLERQSIDMFRSTARFFADPGEQEALGKDLTAMMVLRNYGVPTRLLDWSCSPYVAAYFAVCDLDGDHDKEDGELWTFDSVVYEKKGAEQWRKWPETTIGGDGRTFSAKLTAFAVKEPPDWFVCVFYPSGFPRQNAQAGAYSLTARFGRDHADAIAGLLEEASHFHLYVVRSALKPKLRGLLREKHGIWRGSLFPDSAGAAETARQTVFSDA
jgi:hypothetical protein